LFEASRALPGSFRVPVPKLGKTERVISEVESERVQLPLRETFRTAIRETDSVEALRVAVVLADGHVGVGYGTATPAITGDTLESMEHHINGVVRPALIGQPISHDLFALLTSLTSLCQSGTAAIDLALHDATNYQYAQVNTWSGLIDVRTSVTISAGSAAEMVAAAQRRLDLGFTTVKLKLGLDPSGDVDRLERVTDAVAGKATIWVDANQGWGSVEDTMSKMEQADSLGCLPAMLEQPVKAEEREKLSAIAERLWIPVFADESVQTTEHIEQFSELGGHIEGVNIKFMKFGGLTGSTLAARRAHSLGFKVLLGSMMEHPASVAVAVRFAATLAEPIHDLDAAWWFEDSQPVSYRDSHVYV
jgi:L-Ala-D/L-Glu epimerase